MGWRNVYVFIETTVQNTYYHEYAGHRVVAALLGCGIRFTQNVGPGTGAERVQNASAVTSMLLEFDALHRSMCMRHASIDQNNKT